LITRTLTGNIRKRKGKKVAINIPLYFDENTKEPERLIESKEDQMDSHIYLDAMGFGMGSCCVQCTYQCCNIKEARIIYDQFVVLAPLMMALSGACPIVRGMLSDHDVRWKIISDSVDDRTEEEKKTIKKSRYSSVSCFISPEEPFINKYNDLDLPKNQNVFDRLVEEAKMDPLLAQHFSHLWIRDPLVVYSGKIEIDDEKNNDHFENIQSTNWQTVRFKPPPPNSQIGWRVEFRSIDLQLTDFENAAFVIFITLLVRVFSLFDLNLYIPISKVDQNMERAYKRGALLNQTFFWRKYSLKSSIPTDGVVDQDEIIELNLNEIMNGCDQFPGLINLVHHYLDTINVDPKVRETLEPYFQLLSKRASGEFMSCASYIRNFVKNHPNYQRDSIVNQQINFDLLLHLHKISSGDLRPKEMFGSLIEQRN
jgi:glutamate--cysteine ligase catalytic subunit